MLELQNFKISTAAAMPAMAVAIVKTILRIIEKMIVL